MSKSIDRLYQTYVTLLNSLRSPFLLVIRLYWGWQFFLTGKGKLMNLDRTAGFFTSLHIPAPKLNAIMAGSTECFGGLLLLIGLGSRIATVPLIFTMSVAYVTAEPDKIKNIFNNPDAFVSSAEFLFMLVSIIVLLFGPGVFSVDALIRKMRGGNQA
jgi:putative oxidoreductase